MSKFKFIYHNEKDEHSHVHFLVGYCPKTITHFREMAEELRKTFPQAKDEDIECGRVTKSSYCQGFAIIIWRGKIEKKYYEGWVTRDKTDYFW